MSRSRSLTGAPWRFCSGIAVSRRAAHAARPAARWRARPPARRRRRLPVAQAGAHGPARSAAGPAPPGPAGPPPRPRAPGPPPRRASPRARRGHPRSPKRDGARSGRSAQAGPGHASARTQAPSAVVRVWALASMSIVPLDTRQRGPAGRGLFTILHPTYPRLLSSPREPARRLSGGPLSGRWPERSYSAASGLARWVVFYGARRHNGAQPVSSSLRSSTRPSGRRERASANGTWHGSPFCWLRMATGRLRLSALDRARAGGEPERPDTRAAPGVPKAARRARTDAGAGTVGKVPAEVVERGRSWRCPRSA